MKLKEFFLITTAWLYCVCSINAQNQLVTYPVPQGAELKNDFIVKVREPGKEWKRVDTYLVKVVEVRETKHQVEHASMGYFDFSGEVEVSVTLNSGTIHTGRVRPLSYEIIPQIHENELKFKLDRPRNVSVEVNGDIFHNLHLFANPIDQNVPRKLKDKNLIYFGPGIHRLPGDTLNIPSGKTVYLAGGAVVQGCLQVVDAQNVKIVGRGMAYPKKWAGIRISRSRNVLIEGVMTSQCPTGESDSVTIRNVKAISSYGWGDGMNVFASSNVMFDGVFCRNSDDCTTVYGTRLGYKGGCKNITMQNSTLWADVAHPIFIGLHGNVEQPDTLENLNYVNIDILDHSEKQIDYQGCMAINVGDNNLVRNVRFENIRVENFRQGQLVDMRVSFNKKYCKAPGRGIENVLFKDITYIGNNSELSLIVGYNEERKIKNVRFENLKINGVVISDDMPGKPKWYKTSDMARFFVGEHVEGLLFTK